MTELTVKSPSSEMEVIHYGVKGMHWGVRKSDSSNSVSRKERKASKNSPNQNYSSWDRRADSARYSPAAVRRINRRMNQGADLKTARKKETQRTLLKAAGVVAVYSAPRVLKAVNDILATNGSDAMASIRIKAHTNRGRAQAAATMGLPRDPTNGPTYSKKNRQGVHKITTL